jgi:hypothetical protein
MDFGLGRIFEMFEDRFGRVASTILIFAVGAALFVYSLKVVIETILELHKISIGWLSANVTVVLLNIGWFVVWAVCFMIFARIIYNYYFLPKLERIDKAVSDADEKVAAANRKANEAVAKSQRNVERAEELMRRAEI